MAKAPFLGKSGTVDVEDAVFGAEVKPHLVHEAVRAEQNAQRAGTAATKSRGLVSGGRQKPWRQMASRVNSLHVGAWRQLRPVNMLSE